MAAGTNNWTGKEAWRGWVLALVAQDGVKRATNIQSKCFEQWMSYRNGRKMHSEYPVENGILLNVSVFYKSTLSANMLLNSLPTSSPITTICPPAYS